MTEFLIIAGIAIVWIGCGVLAYGMWIADVYEIWREFTETYGDYEWNARYPSVVREAWLGAVLGPIGLFSTWMTRITDDSARRAKGLRFHR